MAIEISTCATSPPATAGRRRGRARRDGRAAAPRRRAGCWSTASRPRASRSDSSRPTDRPDRRPAAVRRDRRGRGVPLGTYSKEDGAPEPADIRSSCSGPSRPARERLVDRLGGRYNDPPGRPGTTIAGGIKRASTSRPRRPPPSAPPPGPSAPPKTDAAGLDRPTASRDPTREIEHDAPRPRSCCATVDPGGDTSPAPDPLGPRAVPGRTRTWEGEAPSPGPGAGPGPRRARRHLRRDIGQRDPLDPRRRHAALRPRPRHPARRRPDQDPGRRRRQRERLRLRRPRRRPAATGRPAAGAARSARPNDPIAGGHTAMIRLTYVDGHGQGVLPGDRLLRRPDGLPRRARSSRTWVKLGRDRATGDDAVVARRAASRGWKAGDRVIVTGTTAVGTRHDAARSSAVERPRDRGRLTEERDASARSTATAAHARPPARVRPLGRRATTAARSPT